MIARNIDRVAHNKQILLVPLVLALAAYALLVWFSLTNSATVDEVSHLPAGLSYWQTGEYRLNTWHPPLAKLYAAALPEILLRLQLPLTYASWTVFPDEWVFGAETLFSSPDGLATLLAGRLSMALLLLPMIALGWRWSRRYHGSWQAAALTASFLAFEPIFLANGALVHTDMPQALLILALTFAFAGLLRRGTWLRALTIALLFAGLVLTKHSGWIALSWLGLLAVLRLIDPRPWTWRVLPRGGEMVVARLWQRLLALSAVAALALVTWYAALWLSYDFSYDYRLAGQPAATSVVAGDTAWQARLRSFMQQWHPLPRPYLVGFLKTTEDHARPAYLLGTVYPTGTYSYFPWMLLTKTSPVLLLLSAFGLIVLARRLGRRGPFDYDTLALLLPPVLWFALAVWSRFNLGQRYLLPIYPFLAIWAGGLLNAGLVRWRLARQAGATLAAVLLLAGTLWQAPYFLSYFNLFAPRPLYQFVGDSSLDWGQGLIALRDYERREGIGSIELLYFGMAVPSAYGVSAEPIEAIPFRPPSEGTVAISATAWQNNPALQALVDRPPDDVIADSILIYRFGSKANTSMNTDQ